MTAQTTPDPEEKVLLEHPDQQKWDAARVAAEARFSGPIEATSAQLDAASLLAEAVITLATTINALVPDGPQKAGALTELELVHMRANRGIYRPTPKEQRR